MISRQALKTLARFATENIDSRAPEIQIEIYEALAAALPNRHERIAAERLAFSIRETAKLQMEFTRIIKPAKLNH
jgi:hypothetical protein